MISCKNESEITASKTQNQELSNQKLNRVEPPNWWIGFKNNHLQLLVHEKNISSYTPSINYSGVTITKVHKAQSSNYLFIDVVIAKNTKAGKFDIVFKDQNGNEKKHTYEVKKRKKVSKEFKGFNSSDAIYLITPDRFVNGNSQNDINTNLKEEKINRADNYARHGGDIAGIIKHLDYIETMGFTQIWSSPLLTNNMPKWSYHGYAITDYYEVDPRFGTLAEYKKLADKANNKGIGLIMDQVVNHCGLHHWWMKDLPFNDWVNAQKHYEDNRENWDWKKVIHSNHRRTSNQDMYASKADKKGMTDGWFVADMPDLNQRNPYMATYLIQNSIWWIETLELSGIRQDTYPYPDKKFMANWAGVIMKEYPNFSIVGEEWSYNPLLIGYWQDGAKNKDGYKSNLTSTMDFAMQKHITEGLTEKESWDKGLVKIYEGLANDFIYSNPKMIMAFMDNHDKSRVFTEFKGDVTNTKMALSYLLTLPRIPQIYYGTEILMDDFVKPGDHGLIRTDFPGGWQEDKVNAFTGKGLTNIQKDMQQYVKKLLNFRKNSAAIHNGKTVHFAPKDGVYVLFRTINNETVVHIINKNEKPYILDLSRFDEIGLQKKKMKNIITGNQFVWNDKLKLHKKGSVILTTKN